MRASFPMVSTTNIFSPSSWRCVLQEKTLRAKRTEPLHSIRRHQSRTECITLPFKTRFLMCPYDHFCTGYTINLAKLGFLSAKLIGIANFTLTLENYGIFLFLLKEALISRTTAPASRSGLAFCLEKCLGQLATPVGTSRTVGSVDIAISVLPAVFGEIKHTTCLEEKSFLSNNWTSGDFSGAFGTFNIFKQNAFSQFITGIICTAIYKVITEQLLCLETGSWLDK